MLHQSSTSGSVLKSLNVESETLSVNSAHTTTLKRTGVPCTLSESCIPMHDFVTSCVIGKILVHQAYAGFPNADLFHYNISKHRIWEYHHQTHQKKSVKYWEAVKLTMADSDFPKFEFFLESLNFITGDKYFQLFSWRDRLTFF